MINADLFIGIFGIVFGAFIFAFTRDLSRLGGVFLDSVLVVIFFLSIIMVVKSLLKPEKLAIFDSAVERNNVLMGIIILLLYLILMPIIGFLPSSYIFYFCFNVYLAHDRWSRRNILQSAALSLVVVSFFFAMFYFVLGVPLPQGVFFES